MNINQQIAIKGAKLLGYEIVFSNTSASDTVVCVIDNELMDLSPVNNGTDMNKLIEALKIEVYWLAGPELWAAKLNHNDITFEDKTRDEAIRQCVIKALGIGVDND